MSPRSSTARARRVSTGLPFFDHMLTQLGKHGGFDLVVKATGDLEVDAHHTVEDVGIALGETLREALGDKAGVRRFASMAVPARRGAGRGGAGPVGPAVPRLRGRSRRRQGGPTARHAAVRPQLAEEFWRAFATAAGITLHVRMRSGRNTHHILEASFKGVARALRDAVRIEGGGVPSTKGMLGMIAVLDYGIGNLRSAEKALQHVGADARLVTDPDEADGAAAVVLPGRRGLRALHGGAAGERARRGGAEGDRPRGRRSSASASACRCSTRAPTRIPRWPGSGVLAGRGPAVCADGVKHPQMQWNLLRPGPARRSAAPGSRRRALGVLRALLRGRQPTEDVVATCDYGGPVTAAVERGTLWATQFHPEKSGAVGLALLANFVAAVDRRPATA